MSDIRQNQQLLLPFEQTDEGDTRNAAARGAESLAATNEPENLVEEELLMEEICERNNLLAAYKRVKTNKGSPGVDGVTTEQLKDFLKEHWPAIRTQLLEGTYKPQPVRKVEIPKSNGGVRQLGIPTVLDRLIQQAVMQVLQSKWDPTFSDHSYGFRPGRSAHQAVAKAQSYVSEGCSWVVDIDLEKFFDQVNHDKLMSEVSKRVKDKRLLKLLRSMLRAGVMDNGLVRPTDEGTPQGGPLSPLLSNLMLDQLDQELERRGHRFCRYADDCNIYVRSQKAGDRVMESVTQFITKKLKLKVNRMKSAVDWPSKRKFLGFTLFKGRGGVVKRKVSAQALQVFKAKVQKLTRRARGVSVEEMVQGLRKYLLGWRGYFGFSEAKTVLQALDMWIRRRIRCVIWHQWQTFKARRKGLMQRGIDEVRASMTAYRARGPWEVSHKKVLHEAFPNRYFDSLGLPRLGN